MVTEREAPILTATIDNLSCLLELRFVWQLNFKLFQPVITRLNQVKHCLEVCYTYRF